MTILLLLLLGVLVLAMIGIYLIYVQLIKKKNQVKQAEASIDVQLKKRYDLIPNILTIAKKFMEHERSLIEDITKLRMQASQANEMSEKIKLDNAIKGKMDQLMINVENYPQLKSDATMVQAMQTYAEVEEHIAAARRFYNSAVNQLNNAVEIFPSSVIAGMLNIKAKPFFEIAENEKQTINAADIL